MAWSSSSRCLGVGRISSGSTLTGVSMKEVRPSRAAINQSDNMDQRNAANVVVLG